MKDRYFLGWGSYKYTNYDFSYWGDKILVYYNRVVQGIWRVKTLK
jgi:hypothetical protein